MEALATRRHGSPQGRRKVVHVVVAGDIGGAERFLVNLASRAELTDADHCVALMTPNPRLREFLMDARLTIRDRGPVRENPLAYLWRSFGPADVAWLDRVLLEEGASLVHAHTFGSHILAVRAALRRGLPVLRTEHGVRHYRDPTCALYRRWALRNTNAIAAVSEFVGRFVASVAPGIETKIRVIRNGIDLAHFHGEAPPVDGPVRFSVISRLQTVRRVDLAIEAVARLPQARLDIAGEGSEREKLEALARNRGAADRVRFLGYQSDPRPVIAASHAVINCTYEDGLGLAVLEAAAMQRPAIAFAGGGIPEIVQDRRTGWLVKSHSVEGFAAALAEASANRTLTAEFGLNARAWVEARFGIDEMCKRYATVYRDLAERRHAAFA